MAPVDQIRYAMAYALPAVLLAALAWTTEYAALFEPEAAAVSNIAAFAATYFAAQLLVPYGLWAAMLVPCATFTTLFVCVAVLATWRRPQWGRVVFSLGRLRRESLSPVLDVRQLRSLARVAADSALWQIGEISSWELSMVVVGPLLPHADFAALNIISTLAFVFWSIDEGINEGLGTLLSLEVGRRDKPPSLARLQRLALAGGATALTLAIATASLPLLAGSRVAALFTAEADVARAFLSACPPLFVSRVAASGVELWMVTMKTVERSRISALSSNAGLVALVLGSLLSARFLGATIHSVMLVWAAVPSMQLCFAAAVSLRLNWVAEIERTRALVPSDSDPGEDGDDDAA